MQVSFNRISEIGLGLLSDMGCVYHLGQDYGTKISDNVCSQVQSFDYGGCVRAVLCVCCNDDLALCGWPANSRRR